MSIGKWISERRISFEGLPLARKAIVIGLLCVLALALGLTVRGVGFDRSSLIQCALVGLLFGGVLGFGGLIFTGIVSQKTGLSENDQ